MFYLSSYFKTLWHGKSVGFFYGVLTLLVLTFSANMFNFKANFIDQNQNPYFNALFNSKINSEKIVKKLKDIPGVVTVLLNDNLTQSRGIKSLLSSSSSIVAKEILDANYVNLKVELSPHIEKRSQELIMEYLRKIVGNSKVTLSEVIESEAAKKSSDPIKKIILNYGHIMMLIFLSIVWIFATWTIGQRLQNRSYLINMFQRRRLVTFKMFTSGQVFWLIASLALSFYLNGSISTLLVTGLLLTTIGLSLLSIRKNEFIKA